LAVRPPSPDTGSIEVTRLRTHGITRDLPPPPPTAPWLPQHEALEATWSYVIRDAVLAPVEGAVWLRSGTPLVEVFGGDRRYAGSQDVRGLTRSRPRERIAGTWLSIPDHTYYHFLVEDLPSILDSRTFARDALDLDPGVLVPDGSRHYVTEAVALLDCESRVVKPARVSVERLVTSGFTTTQVNPHSIDSLRDFMGVEDTPGTGWILASRVGYRRSPSWEEQLISLLSDRLPGLQVVECARLTLRQQAELFSRSAGVIGVHGAALANLIWMSDGSRVVELATPGYNDLYWRLATLRGLAYHVEWPESSTDTQSLAARIAAFADF